MNDPVEDAINPIAPPEHLETEAPLANGDFYSKCVSILSVLLVVAALIGSAIGFAGFVENDQNVTHLLSAFALCFGLGGLAFVPLSIITIYARKAIWAPMPRQRAVIVLLLLLPWFFLSFYLFALGGQLRYGSVAIVICGLFIGAWALRYLKFS